MGDMLSQDELDALLSSGPDETPPETEDTDETTVSENSESFLEETKSYDNLITIEQKDVLGEVGNISMGTAATTLFALLGQKVMITTPEVTVMSWKELQDSYNRPCVGIRVNYTEGLKGSNILVLKERDVKIISSLMMGKNGVIEEDSKLSDIDLSAISEAMNQMVGSSSTSISSMIKAKIDIDTPYAFLLDFTEDDFFETVGLDPKEYVVCTAFRMVVGSLIDSEIMQILPVEFALEMVNKLRIEIEPVAEEAADEPTIENIDNENYVNEDMIGDNNTTTQGNEDIMADSTVNTEVKPQPAQQNAAQYQQRTIPQAAQQNVNVSPAQFQNFDVNAVMQQKENIDIIMDVPLEVTVELGRTHKKIREILEFTKGTIIELDKLAGEPIDILVNGKFVAKGEVVVIDENFGIRITDIINPENRI